MLGMLEWVNGIRRSILDKLKGIKSDLVRGQENWQDWDLLHLIHALKKWRNINPWDEQSGNKERYKNQETWLLIL